MNGGLAYTESHVLGTAPGLSPRIRTAVRLSAPRANVATMGFNRRVAIKASTVALAGTAFNRYLHLTFALYSCDSMSCDPGSILLTVPKAVTVDGGGHFSAQAELPSGFTPVEGRHYYIAVLATGALKTIDTDTARGDISSGLSSIAHGTRLDESLPLVGLVRDGIFGAIPLDVKPTPTPPDNGGGSGSGACIAGPVTKIRPGDITTIAGAQIVHYSGDGGPALDAGLGYLTQVAVDRAGTIYLADSGHAAIRRIDRTTGRISTFAQAAVEKDLTVDAAGNLFFIGHAADNKLVVLRVDGRSGVVTAVPGSSSLFAGPPDVSLSSVTVAPSGNLLFSDLFRYVVRSLDPTTGVVRTIAYRGGAR